MKKWEKTWECDVDCVCDSITFRWIHEKEKVIYWEVPRVGSSSLKKSIKPPEWRHLSVDEVDEIPYEEYLNFTTIVNPWRRVASCYWLYTHYDMRIRECDKLFGGPVSSFEEFVTRMFDEGSRNHHWYPVSNYVPPEDAPFDWLQIPLEKLTTEWNVLAHTFDFPMMNRETQLATVNQKPWREHYINHPNLFNVVAGYYEEDLRRFGSSFSSAVVEEFPPEETQ